MLYDMDPRQPGRTSRYGRQVYHNEKSDWSRTIRELLIITGALPLRLKGKIHGLYEQDLSRLGGEVFHMVSEPAALQTGAPRKGFDIKAEKGEGKGIGVLVVETGSEPQFPLNRSCRIARDLMSRKAAVASSSHARHYPFSGASRREETGDRGDDYRLKTVPAQQNRKAARES